jgi:hypothetical protein
VVAEEGSRLIHPTAHSDEADDHPPDPKRHSRSYGDEPLPTGREALDEPLAAFPSWFMRITCDRCGKDCMLNEGHTPERQRAMPIRDIIARMRPDGCGGRGREGGVADRHRGREQPARRIGPIAG